MDVTPTAFAAISTLDVDEIANLSSEEIRPLLPCLVRLALCPSFDNSQVSADKRKRILKIISQNEEVNSIISLLSDDFHAMEIDVRKELEQKSVIKASLGDIKSSMNDNNDSSIVNNLSLDFERSEGFCRLRLIIGELFAIKAYANLANTNRKANDCFCASELFDHDVYINELSDVICIALAELPDTLQLLDIIETLLFVKTGPRLIIRITANFSYRFHDICLSLLMNSDHCENEESLIGNVRINVIRSLCKMNPPYALVVREFANKICKMPTLGIYLALDHIEFFNNDESNCKMKYINDLVLFVRDILLGNEDKAKNWFKDGHKKSNFLEENILNNNELIKNEVLHEPVYTLVCQVYNKLDSLLNRNEDSIEKNKELLLMFANVFTLFNSTISEKIKLQHETEDYKDRNQQLVFLNTKEKENVHRLKEKLEEYEAQSHEDIQKYESEISYLENKIKLQEKDKRKLEYENEDNLKELKHIQNLIEKFLDLIKEYSSNEIGIAQFFQIFLTFLDENDYKNQGTEKMKIIFLLNNTLEKKLVDVRNAQLKMQEEKISNMIKVGEEKMNKIFENGSTHFIKNEFSYETNIYKPNLSDICLKFSNNNYVPFDETNELNKNRENIDKDDLNQHLIKLKELNQANFGHLKTFQKISFKEKFDIEYKNLVNLFVQELIDEYIRDEIKKIKERFEEKRKSSLNDILNTGLVKINSNNEIVTSTPETKISQAKLMLINENLNQSIVEGDISEEVNFHRFEQSFTEIIRNSVTQNENDNVIEGETLQSILKETNCSTVNNNEDFNSFLNSQTESSNNNNNLNLNKKEVYLKELLKIEKIEDIDFKILEILEEISKLDDFHEIINIENLMKKSSIYLKNKKKKFVPNLLINKSNSNAHKINNYTDFSLNKDKILTKNSSQMTDSLIKLDKSTNTPINKELKNSSISCNLIYLNQENKSTETFFAQKDVSLFCNLNELKDCSTHIEEKPTKSTQTLLTKLNNLNKSNQTEFFDDTFSMYFKNETNGICNNNNNINKINNNYKEISDINDSEISIELKKNNHNQKSNNSVNNKCLEIKVKLNEKVDEFKKVRLIDIDWKKPSFKIFFTLLFYTFCFLKNFTICFIFFSIFIIIIIQMILSTNLPPYHSWEEILSKVFIPYLTKEYIYES